MIARLKSWIAYVSRPFLAGLVVICVAGGLHVLELPTYLNEMVFDGMMVVRGKRPVSPEVVIVDVDEKSLRAIGRWPWSRKRTAELVRAINRAKARTIAFDMTFSERDEAQELTQKSLQRFENSLSAQLRQSGVQPALIKKLGREIERSVRIESGDYQLYDSIRNVDGSVVLGYFMRQRPTHHFQHLGEKAYEQGFEGRLKTISESATEYADLRSSASKQLDANGEVTFTDDFSLSFFPKYTFDLVSPISSIAKATQHFGYFNNFPDPDNTSRHAMLVHRIGQHYYPSLALKAVATHLGASVQVLRDSSLSHTIILVNNKGEALWQRTFSHDGRFRINYYGPQRTFPYVSALDVMQGDLPAGTLEDKLVLIGTSAPGLFDLIKIPYAIFADRQAPGVELHANVASNILLNDTLIAGEGIYTIFMLLVPIIGLFIFIRTNSIIGVSTLLFFIVSEIGLSYWLFQRWSIVVHIAIPLLTLLFVYISITLSKYRQEEKRRKFIRKAFEHYLSPAVIKEIVDDPDRLSLRGERKHVTMLFSDIRDFTSISEKLTPQALSALLAKYLTPMTEIILDNSGTLDKYIGDAIMAIFGAPVPATSHAASACSCALRMVEALRRFNYDDHGYPPLQMGIGINTGEASVGNMGSTKIFCYTALGDAVNLASRLEGITKQYGAQLIVSESTSQEAGSDFLYRELDRIRVKGRSEPVTVLELVTFRQEALEDDFQLVESFEEGLRMYRDQQWYNAIVYFERCLKINPQDLPSKLFIKRSREYMDNPPQDDWNGVYTFKSK